MKKLIDAAKKARQRAVAPYSNFKVGAAVETRAGKIFGGCNVENASYGLTLCAERVAIFKAISEGAKKFARIAVVTDTATLTPPCGPCRQIIWEFCGDIPVVMANLSGKQETVMMRDLVEHSYRLVALKRMLKKLDHRRGSEKSQCSREAETK